MFQQSSYVDRRWPQRGWGRFITALTLVLAVLVLGPRANAQVQTGINGTVVDTTGAIISGAVVTVKETSTGTVKERIATSTAGTFVAVGMLPGNYSVTVNAKGFETAVIKNVTVEITKISSVAVTLTPGSVSETVTVAGNEISLNTTQPEIGATLEPELVEAIPNEVSGGVRSPSNFVLQMPGVTLPQNRQVLLAGGELEMSSYYMNGLPIGIAGTNNVQSSAPPPYELVKEFHVSTSAFPAQYGLSQGAVTYNTASGTRDIHGSVFEILRNSLFDSDGFFPTSFNSAGKPIPPVNHQNDWGFTVAGPVVLPKLYHGRDRTFFLFTIDRYNAQAAQTAIGTVPTVAMKTGDFSHFVNSSGVMIPVYDPQTGQPFPGNIIPQSRFSPLAKSILPFIPDPNRTGTNSGLQNNENPAISALPKSVNTWGFTVNHTISKSQSIGYTQWHYYSNAPSLSAAPIVPATNELQSESNNTVDGDGYLVNYTYTATPNLITTAGVASVGFTTNQDPVLKNTTFQGVADPVQFPSITFSDQNTMTLWGIGTTGTTENLDQERGTTISNNWLWLKGRHTFNFGVQVYYLAQNALTCQGCSGVFNFSQAETSTPNSSDPNFSKYGSAFASFLLGQVDSGTRTLDIMGRDRSSDWSPYFQDDFKVTNRLTINAGLRWDLMVPFHETSNNIVFANLSTPNPNANNLLGAMSKFGSCIGCAGVDRADIHWKNFGPRLGFSYMVNSKTVLQSGFFLAFLPGGAYAAGMGRVPMNYVPLLAGSFTRNKTGSNVPGYGNWDTNPMPDPPTTPFNPTMGNGQNVNILNQAQAGTAPYAESWNVSIQRQLPWDQFLTLAYIGARTIHLETALNQPNQLNPAFLSYGSLLSASVTSSAAKAAGIQIPYPNFVSDFGTGATVKQALLPYPQFLGVSNPFDMSGRTSYNEGMVQAEKRFRNGLSYMASVVFSRNMDSADQSLSSKESAPLNTYNQALEYSVSGYDTFYQTKGLFTYALPFGPGKKFLNSSRLLGELVGGWQVAGILNYWGGLPFGATDGVQGVGASRPNTVQGQYATTYSYQRSKDYFEGKTAVQPKQFNTAFFSLPASYTLGDSKRNYATLRQPPLRMENFEIMKSFHIAERVSAVIRLDYFNAFNRTQLEPPDANESHSTFGQITNLASQISNRQGQATFRIQF